MAEHIAGELTYTYQLIRSLHAGMIVLLDRNFAAATLPGAIHASDADILVRLKTAVGCPSFAAYRMARSPT